MASRTGDGIQPRPGQQTATLTSDDEPHVFARHPYIMTVGVMMATLLQILDATIANVALPHMQAALGATHETVTWVLTSYIIASAIALPIAGWMAKRFGVRRLILVSVSLFIVFSMLCGVSVNITEMVIFRVGQGISGAFILPLGQTAVLDCTPRSQHPKIQSWWGTGMMVGPIIGPILGGWLTENFDWRWVFFVNVPLGAVALLLMFAHLPRWKTSRPTFDLAGFAWCTLALASIQLLLDRGQRIGWFDARETWIYAVLALTGTWCAVIHMGTTKNPLFDRRLFTDRNLVVAIIIMSVIGLCLFATMALMPPMLQTLFGYSVLDTGLVLAPRGIGIVVAMQFVRRLALKVDTRLLVGFGFLATAYSLWLMSQWSLQVDEYHIVMTGLIQGFGIGFVFVPVNMVAFATLAPDLRTGASSLLNLMRSLGSSVGISVVSTALAHSIQVNHAEIGAHITTGALKFIDLSHLPRYGPLGDVVYTLIDAEVNRQALMISYLNNFHLMAMICAMAVVIVPLVTPLSRAMAQGMKLERPEPMH